MRRSQRKGRAQHGMSYTPTYKSWDSMMERCYNPNAAGYDYYGGIGIIVCDRWHDFRNFYFDMGNKPTNKTLDRIKNSGNYEPGNCRWSTPREQSLNRSTTRILEYEGKKYVATDLRLALGMKVTTFWNRIKRGWSVERLINQPVAHKGKR